jgi:hypothetical protein
MFDSPVDQKIQDGLKMQATYASLSILNSLVQADHPPISTDNLKKLADIIYTCFYSFHYFEQSSSAEEFLRKHLDEMEYIDWEPELIEGVGE